MEPDFRTVERYDGTEGCCTRILCYCDVTAEHGDMTVGKVMDQWGIVTGQRPLWCDREVF